jgi:hypothetical protein
MISETQFHSSIGNALDIMRRVPSSVKLTHCLLFLISSAASTVWEKGRDAMATAKSKIVLGFIVTLE